MRNYQGNNRITNPIVQVDTYLFREKKYFTGYNPILQHYLIKRYHSNSSELSKTRYRYHTLFRPISIPSTILRLNRPISVPGLCLGPWRLFYTIKVLLQDSL